MHTSFAVMTGQSSDHSAQVGGQARQRAVAPDTAASPSEDFTMSRPHFHKPNAPNNVVPEEFEPGALPVEPDEGPVPALIPDNPKHERDVDPAADQPSRPSVSVTRSSLSDAQEP